MEVRCGQYADVPDDTTAFAHPHSTVQHKHTSHKTERLPHADPGTPLVRLNWFDCAGDFNSFLNQLKAELCKLGESSHVSQETLRQHLRHNHKLQLDSRYFVQLERWVNLCLMEKRTARRQEQQLESLLYA
jgi:hypothetical protein